MIVSRAIIAVFVSAALSFVTVNAQTQAQIQACGNSVIMATYQDIYTFDPADDSHHYNATFTYDATACTKPAQVPVTALRLTNLNGGTLAGCTLSQFSSSGSLYTQCPTTLGEMARQAEEGNDYWSLTLAYGKRPTLYTVENSFNIEYPKPEPEPSGTIQKRSRIALEAKQRRFACPVGQTSCPTESTGKFACLDTASDVTACGGCPFSDEADDCGSIEGVNDVQCTYSHCQVQSCVRGYQVSPDRRSCIPTFRKVKRARGVFF